MELIEKLADKSKKEQIFENDNNENINDNIKNVSYKNVTIDDVIGLEDVKEKFHEILVYFYEKQSDYDKMGISQSRGIILVGPPGVGKSLVCEACVHSYGNNSMDFKKIYSSDLISHNRGESGGRVKRAFKEIEKDTLIFIDEIDMLAPSRRMTNSILAQETTSAILQILDDNPHIIFVGGTNFIERVDEAFLRSGRIDNVIEISYPSYNDRVKMFKKCIEGLNVDENINIKELAENSDGFTGADIIKNLRRKIFTLQLKKKDSKDNRVINQCEIMDMLYSIHKPNLPDTLSTEGKIYDLLKFNLNGLYVKDIVEKLQLHKQNVSRSLTSLKKKKMVNFKQEGRNRLYFTWDGYLFSMINK